MRLQRWCTCLLLLFTLASPVRADDLTADKRADIERLLAMTNALSLGKQMGAATVNMITQSLQKSRPDIPKDALDLLPAEILAVFDENMPALKDRIIPIYDKHFTGAEIKEMIRFYSSPLGKKTIQVMPSLLQEGMATGQSWGQALGPQIEQRVKAKLKQRGVEI